MAWQSVPEESQPQGAHPWLHGSIWVCNGEEHLRWRGQRMVAWGCVQLQRGCLSYVSSVGLAARLRCVLDLSNADSAPPRLHSSRASSSLLVLVHFFFFFSFFSSASTFFHSHPSILSLFSSRSYRSAVLHGRFLCVLVSLRRVPLRLLHSYHYHRLVFLPLPRIQSPRFFSGRLCFGLVSLRGVSI